MVSCTAELMANRSSGKCWSHFLWLSPTYAEIICFNVLFTRSVRFVWGWYAVVIFCVTFHLAQMSWKTADMNCVPRRTEWNQVPPTEWGFLLGGGKQQFEQWPYARGIIQPIESNNLQTLVDIHIWESYEAADPWCPHPTSGGGLLNFPSRFAILIFQGLTFYTPFHILFDRCPHGWPEGNFMHSLISFVNS